METYLYGILLSLFAGLSTIIGGYIGIINKKPSNKFISFVMAAAAGVMVFVSFLEMLADAELYLGMGFMLIYMFLGLFIAFLIDVLLPEQTNVHDHLYDGKKDHLNGKNGHIVNSMLNSEELNKKQHRHGFGHTHRYESKNGQVCDEMFCIDNQKYMKLGLLTMLAITVHNIPEGLAAFSASFLDRGVGLQIAIAIALHNIPEGICVAVPIFIALKNKKTALLYAAISGLAEPFGAVLAWLVISPIISDSLIHSLLAVVAGIMIYISVDTLIPTAKTIEHKHTMIMGFSLGMLIMGLTLLVL